MTAFDFSLVKNTSIAFNATSDSLNLGAIDASTVRIANTSGNLVLTVGTDTVTLTGATAEQLTTSNLTFGTGTARSALFVGDNAAGATFDASGNSINMLGDTTGYVAASQSNSNSLIYGFGGGDAITIGGGNNIVFGGSGIADSTDGNDSIQIGTAAVTTSGSNTIYTNAGNDAITFNTAVSLAGTTNTFFLGTGDDSLSGAALAHAGNFVVSGNTGADTINLTGALGNATIFGGNGIADSTDGNDAITLGTGAGAIYGNSGNDTITAGITLTNKVVSIFGGLGDDAITVQGAAGSTATVSGGTGADTISAAAQVGDVTIYGGNGIADTTDGNDTITAGTGNSVIYGNAGNDSINITAAMVAGKSALAYGGAGNDTLTAASSATTDNLSIALYGNTGDDVFNLNNSVTNEYNFVIGDFTTGDIVNVTLDSTTGASALTVSGGGSSLTIADTNTAAGGTSGFTFQGYSGNLSATNFVISGGTVLATNFSTTAAVLTGTSISAGGAGDYLISGAAADTLNLGTAGSDKAEGGDGDDIIQTAADGLTTADTITGGNGTDSLSLTGVTTAVLADADFTNVLGIEKLVYGNFNFGGVGADTLGTEADQAGIVTIDASALTGTNTVSVAFAATFDNNVTFTGGAGNDTLTGTGSSSSKFTADGGAGNDVLTGDDNTDSLTGGDGNDALVGAAAIDTLTGGIGNDTINGGAGADVLSGGAGSDHFVYIAAGDSTVTALDKISDFDKTVDSFNFETGAGSSEASIVGATANQFTAAGVVTGTLATSVAAAGSLAAAVALVEGATITTNELAIFTFGGHSYLLQEDAGNSDGVVANVVEITGVTGITGITEVGGANADIFTLS